LSRYRYGRVFGKLLGRYHQHRQLDQLFQPIQVAEMFLRDGEGVKCRLNLQMKY
jgi:hypothetical protein